MANWQASRLMQTLSTGSALVLQRNKTDKNEIPTLHGGDTFYGSLPDGDPFGGTVIERHENRTIVEVNQKRYHRRDGRPAARILGYRLSLPPQRRQGGVAWVPGYY